MSLALLSILPQDVAQQVNGYAIQLSVTQRLTNGWKEIHEEMSLLRRVNSNWIPMNGTIIPSAMLELESQETQEEYWEGVWQSGDHDELLDGDYYDNALDYAAEMDYDHDADYREDQAMAWM